MKYIYLRFFLLHFFCALIFSTNLLGQKGSFEKVIQQIDTYRVNNLQEKLYLQTDRERYLCGEIMWLNAYYVNGMNHQPLDVSKVAYVELLDAENNAVLQAKIPLSKGIGEGSIFLPTSITSGVYVLRAYTNWMKNFDPSNYFHKEIEIINTFKRLPLREKTDSLDFKLSFYPESGNLVRGLKSKIAFKGVNHNGLEIDFNASVVTDLGDTVVTFSPYKDGTGTFEFLPEGDKEYKVVGRWKNLKKEFTLPKIFDNGYVMALKDQNEHLQLEVSSNYSKGEMVHLLIHSRQKITFVESKVISEGRVTFMVDKSLLDDGISHITLFNQENTPVCERIYFNDLSNKLNVNIKTDKNSYSTRHLVNVDITVSDQAQNLPQQANMSISVFKMDSINKYDSDILTYLFLDSELRGNIDHRKYALKNGVSIDKKMLDHLMLTHGWSRYRWEDILSEESRDKEFVPEYRGHIINAKIFNKETNGSVKNIATYLSLPGLLPQMTGSISDDEGNISFVLDEFYGSHDILLKTNFTKDSIYEFSFESPFSGHFSDFLIEDDFYISKSLASQLKQRSFGLQTRNVYYEDQINSFNYQVEDSSAFYNEPNKRYYLDDYTRFTAMEDVMREYVPGIWVRKDKEGFYFRAIDMDREVIFEKNPMVLYDGIPIFDIDKVMQIDPLKVKKLEVVNHRYHYGDLSFDGIVNFSSYTGNIPTYQVDPRALIVEYDGYLEKRDFYAPDYEENPNTRKPDYRNLLMWEGAIQTNQDGLYQSQFHTSEEKGSYLIIIQGISDSGLAGEGAATFEVNDLNN